MKAKPVLEEKQLRFNYEALDAETREFVEERAAKIHHLARMTATGITLIGQYLAETKERLPHGKFMEWIEREFAWKERSARDFMHVFEMSKSADFADLPINASALCLIAAPSTPEPVRAEVIHRAKNGELVSHAGARALKQEFEETGIVPAKSFSQILHERRELIACRERNPADPHEISAGLRLFANLREPASETWDRLWRACELDAQDNLRPAIDALSRLDRARPKEAQ